MAALMQSATLVGTKLQCKVSVKSRRGKSVIMANTSGPKKGVKSAPAQAAVGYKGSTEGGSAPKVYKGKGAKGNGKAGYVYKLGLRNGKANIDEYAPIYVPKDFKTDGDTYEGDLRLVFAAVAGIVVTGAGAILLTSSL